MLTSHKKLAMTSATPGKTTLINHFLINDQWYIVDLPGYGYAQRGKQMQKQIRDIIESYILNRWQMTNLFLLIDCRLAPQKIDLEFMNWLGENEIPFSIVFTKLDKLSAAAGKKQIENIWLSCKKAGRNSHPFSAHRAPTAADEPSYSTILRSSTNSLCNVTTRNNRRRHHTPPNLTQHSAKQSWKRIPPDRRKKRMLTDTLALLRLTQSVIQPDDLHA